MHLLVLNIMAKLSLSAKRTIINLDLKGFSTAKIIIELNTAYGISVSRQCIHRFLYCYKKTMRLVRKPGSGRPSKMTDAVLRAVEAKMQADDETTATQLVAVLNQCGVLLSLATIKRCRRLLG